MDDLIAGISTVSEQLAVFGSMEVQVFFNLQKLSKAVLERGRATPGSTIKVFSFTAGCGTPYFGFMVTVPTGKKTGFVMSLDSVRTEVAARHLLLNGNHHREYAAMLEENLASPWVEEMVVASEHCKPTVCRKSKRRKS